MHVVKAIQFCRCGVLDLIRVSVTIYVGTWDFCEFWNASHIQIYRKNTNLLVFGSSVHSIGFQNFIFVSLEQNGIHLYDFALTTTNKLDFIFIYPNENIAFDIHRKSNRTKHPIQPFNWPVSTMRLYLCRRMTGDCEMHIMQLC